MMMTAIDAPGLFLHKAIPPHQLLEGRVQLSQHNTDTNVAIWLLLSTFFSPRRSKRRVCISERAKERKHKNRHTPSPCSFPSAPVAYQQQELKGGGGTSVFLGPGI